jgi:adenylate cyclase
LATYVGKNAGERVLAGHVRRGDRGDPRRDLAVRYAWLHYAGRHVAAADENGGELLKYMGDGLLAIFPIGLEADFPATSSAALAAGTAARQSPNRRSSPHSG